MPENLDVCLLLRSAPIGNARLALATRIFDDLFEWLGAPVCVAVNDTRTREFNESPWPIGVNRSGALPPSTLLHVYGARRNDGPTSLTIDEIRSRATYTIAVPHTFVSQLAEDVVDTTLVRLLSSTLLVSEAMLIAGAELSVPADFGDIELVAHEFVGATSPAEFVAGPDRIMIKRSGGWRIVRRWSSCTAIRREGAH
jgi:hypothetical protein